MECFFQPASIAVIGATPNRFKGGNAILRNLIAGFRGAIYPVNPKYDRLEEMACYPSVQAIPDHVDLAIVFVPAQAVPAAVIDCAAKRVPGLIVESGGFAETGASGRLLQQQLKDLTQRTGVRIWGPNCMGLVDAPRGHVFSFADPQNLKEGLIPGNVSLIVQSGMLSAGFLFDIMTNGVMGINKVCSLGNKVDVDECDVLSYLLQDASTSVIGCYLESIGRGRHFVELCRESDKPIVVLKGGKSRKGAQAALSHTASLAGNRDLIASVLHQVRVVEANDFKQMMDLCRSLDMSPPVPPPSLRRGRVAVLTFSGGAGIVTADFLEETGLPMAELSPDTRDALAGLFPPWMPVTNPVDLWPAVEKHLGSGRDVFCEALRPVLADPEVDAVLLHLFIGRAWVFAEIKGIAETARAVGKPVFIWLLGRRDEAFRFQQEARTQGIPVFFEIHRAVECMAATMHRRPRVPEPAPGCEATAKAEPAHVPVAPAKDAFPLSPTWTGPLDEHLSKQLLASWGIPTVPEEIVPDAAAACAAALRFGDPVVLKGLAPGIVHKTEHGLVRLGIAGKETLRAAFGLLAEKLPDQGRILLQKQVQGDLELILGLVRDPQFGLCVMLGIGGVLAEAIRDVAFAMAPLTRREALDTIDRLRMQRLLDGFRGAPPVDRNALAAWMVNLGEMGSRYPRIREVDINPLVIGPAGAWAVDATIVLD